MPSLGFLKKKRTKDSQGSNDYNPSSPVDKQQQSPITPTLSKTSTNNTHPSEPDSATDSAGPTSTGPSAPATATSPPPMNPAAGPQQAQVTNPSSNTQNVPSIQNLIHPPNYGGAAPPSSQHDSAYSSADGGANNGVPHLNIPGTGGKPTSNPVRETKGKYTLADFTISRTLGTGSFGRVHLVQSKHNQRFYAVKVLKKAQVVKMKQVEHTNDERRMLQRCRHPFLITLWGTWQDSKNLYMVMDFIEGGELFSLLRKSQVHLHSHTSIITTILISFFFFLLMCMTSASPTP